MAKFDWRECDIVKKTDGGIIYRCPDKVHYFITSEGRVFKEESRRIILIDQIETKIGKLEALQALSESDLEILSKALEAI